MLHIFKALTVIRSNTTTMRQTRKMLGIKVWPKVLVLF